MSEHDRRRAYHHNRAIVNKINREPTPYAIDRMTEAELWRHVMRLGRDLRDRLAHSADVPLARSGRDLCPALDELFLRGHQVPLWDETTPLG